ncbi:hypothetical protein [Desulfosarcina cetonica]|uniref:hypothetical protein n=1 Tax=Desulfosarcina cetonica TaxID=90730 RepID=UPI0006CF3612|nr:hypothetical protein [Desulfosarcina cetonica]
MSPIPDPPPAGPSIVGIDLGTTNSAVAHVDPVASKEAKTDITLLEIPQLTGLGEFAQLPVLPSFLYLPGPYDIDPAAIRHPWPTTEDSFVGMLARDHGAHVPPDWSPRPKAGCATARSTAMPASCLGRPPGGGQGVAGTGQRRLPDPYPQRLEPCLGRRGRALSGEPAGDPDRACLL